MKMPLTAIVLIFEFTRVGHDFLIPISLAVTGSVSAFHLCVERKTQPTWRAHHEDIPIGTGDPVLNRVRAATRFSLVHNICTPLRTPMNRRRAKWTTS
jgi:hypothetical protein